MDIFSVGMQWGIEQALGCGSFQIFICKAEEQGSENEQCTSQVVDNDPISMVPGKRKEVERRGESQEILMWCEQSLFIWD